MPLVHEQLLLGKLRLTPRAGSPCCKTEANKNCLALLAPGLYLNDEVFNELVWWVRVEVPGFE